MFKCESGLISIPCFGSQFTRLAATWWCHALIILFLALKTEASAAREDGIKIHMTRDHADYSSHLPLADPLIKSFCKNCNLVLSEPELMTFVENFYKSVNQVTSARNRLAYQMECDGCNVILAASADIPRVVEVLASSKQKHRS